jgi:hypothetical protein
MKITRLYFITDMTMPHPPEIFLGFFFQDGERISLIGRSELEKDELALINLLTWGEMIDPFSIMIRILEDSRDNGAVRVPSFLYRSPFRFRTDDVDEKIDALIALSELCTKRISDMT